MPERATRPLPPPACHERALGWDPTVRPRTDSVTLFLARPSARQAPGGSAHPEGQPPPQPDPPLSSRLCSETQSRLVTRGLSRARALGACRLTGTCVRGQSSPPSHSMNTSHYPRPGPAPPSPRPPPSSAHASATFLRLRWARPGASVGSEPRPTPETKEHVLALPGEKGTCRPWSHVYVLQMVACSCGIAWSSVPTIPYEAQMGPMAVAMTDMAASHPEFWRVYKTPKYPGACSLQE